MERSGYRTTAYRALSRLTPRPLRDLAKRWLGHHPDPQRDELVRLRKLPRYQRTTTTLMGHPIDILDAESFLTMHAEIVREGIYYFPATSQSPYIIDGGANIGISVLYFKQIYPASRIVAFEPDEAAFSLLRQNLISRGCEDVTLVRGALAGAEASRAFLSEGSYASRLLHEGDSPTTQVTTVRLRPYLNQRLDLLKLNIEGAETEVLEDCADLLGCVERIVLEYHSFATEPQSLHRLTNVLARAGFRLYVRSVHRYWPLQPFVNVPVDMGMDLQLYVYAFRDAAPGQ